jgi:hypothetical protein
MSARVAATMTVTGAEWGGGDRTKLVYGATGRVKLHTARD